MCIINMKYLLLIIILIFSLLSCKGDLEKKDSNLSVITYNLYNLFDDIDDKTEHSSYRPNSGYTARDFKKRIELYCTLFKKEEFDADILFFQEVESQRVLEFLLDSGMRRRGYIYYGLAKLDNIPNTVGFISKIKPHDVQVHNSGSARPFISLSVFKNNVCYKIFALHAKSNIGEDSENKKDRIQTARHIKSLINENENIIVLGDFNSTISSDDMLRSFDSVDSLFVSCNSNSVDVKALYDATEDIYFPLNRDGTYNYNGKWYYYDKILISKSIVDKNKYSFRVLDLPELSKDGFPNAYDNSSESGYSDHFALKLTLGE